MMPSRPNDQWSSKAQFLLACIGSGAGLSQILRFPYICYRYGGAAFLIPYFIMLAFFAAPLVYMEISVGQLTGVGPMPAMGMLCPLLKGVGITMVILCFFASTLYITYIAYTLQYFVSSFNSPLPWTVCGQLWNTPNCLSNADNSADVSNVTEMEWEWNYVKPSPSSQEYFNNYVLHLSDGIDHLGGIVASLAGYLFLAWILCYICIFKGRQSVEKIVYVTTLIPYGILFALLLRFLTLPGSIDGVRSLFLPDWQRLLDPQTWTYAVYEAVSGVGAANGCLILFASYNVKRNNIYHDTLVITATSCITSLVAGCVVFGAYGAIAYKQSLSMAEVVGFGPEIIFVMVPPVFTDIPGSNAWAALYFLMLITLGISTQFPLVHVVTTSTLHQFQDKLKNVRFRKELVSLVVCFVSFIFCLMYVTQGGKFMIHFMDFYIYLPSPFLLYFEVLAICWLYGGNRLAREISFSSGHRPYYVFPFLWIFIVPVIVSFIAWPSLMNMVMYGFSGYNYPLWTSFLGMLLTIFCIMWIPFGIFHELYKNGQGKSCCASLFKSVTPTFVGAYTLRKQRALEEYQVSNHRTPIRDNEGSEAEQVMLATSSAIQNDEIVESPSDRSPMIHQQSSV